MFSSSRIGKLALYTAGLSVLAFCGSPSFGGQGPAQDDGSDLSGPPEINIAYHAREPRRCKAVATPPTHSQLVPLIQCTMEYEAASGIYLVQDVMAEISTPRDFEANLDSNLKEIDIASPVYPLTGSLKVYWCSPVSPAYPAGQGCKVSPMPEAVGKCWKTTFGDWKCNLTGPTPYSREKLPGPTTY